MSSNAADGDGARRHNLDSRFDDTIDPEEITIFPKNVETPTTQWLTIDAEFAVPIEKMQ